MRQRQLTTSDLEDLLHRLHATATVTSQPAYSYTPWEYSTASEYDMRKHMKVHDTVEMKLPLDKLREVAEVLLNVEDLEKYYGPGILRVGQQIMIDKMVLKKERQIRDKNPAVQKAWEHYQTMLNLVRNDE